MRKLLLTAALACAAHAAHAAEAGKIIFVAGKANAGDSLAREGAPVAEGQMLRTGADGFIYVKTIDNGLFILRPNTQARIVTYRVDRNNPANTRIKLELLNGVARSKSGEAVKLARQNFRFNTPVAAIGVRGTDFTVFTDSDTSRVAVLSGGVVVSGFSGGCRPEGAGPCEGEASRELSAAQRGQLVQVRRGQAAQVLQGSPLSPDQVSPPRGDEPLTQNGAGVPSASIEAMKNAGLAPIIDKVVDLPAQPDVPDLPPLPGDPVVVVPDPVVPPQPERTVVWGRWQNVGASPATLDYAAQGKKNELIALNGYFALFRTPGKEYVAPNNGSVGFGLRGSEAYVVTEYGAGIITTAPAKLTNGSLNVDFDQRSFATSLDLDTKGELFKLQASGTVSADGRLYSEAANGRHGVINVQGLLSNERGGSAAYLFDGRLDDKRTVNGGATWR